mgnify:CR=1 FL=1
MTSLEKNIFSIGLVMLAFSNATWFLTAVSNRTSVIANAFILGAFVLLLCRGYLDSRKFKNNLILKYSTKISMIGFVPLFIYKVSDVLDYPSFFVLFAPFVVWVNDTLNMSLKEGIKLFTGLG